MAGAIVGLHVFGADTGPEPLANLDNNYTAIVAAVNSLNSYSNYYIDSGAVNALVVTTAGGQTITLTDGLLLEIQAGNTTTSTAPTINVNGLGAQAITDNFGNALQLGAMVSGGRYFLLYDGAKFRLLNPAAAGQRGVAICKFKAANTTRNTTTTNANDPDLVYSIPAAGTYGFRVLAIFFATTTATMGISANVNYSGTFTAASSFIIIQDLATVGLVNAAVQLPAAQATNVSGLNSGTAISLVSSAPTWMDVRGVLTATGAGILGYAWAQNTSSANNLNMVAGSFIEITQLS